ncbi:MAG TPA: tetratricopeptide repeat protein [Terriglobales bacterium]|nr:tetratricopeptide repeat protein [Terriglobales bacterium]
MDNKSWTAREAYLLAMVTLFVGLIAGYLFHGSSTPSTTTAAAPQVGGMPPAAPDTLQSPEQLRVLVQPMLDAARANPSDPGPLVQIGNTYYDHKFYAEAITYYQKALALKPNDVNVRTDLGTALWYTGSAKEAVAEFEKSLKVDPNHAQTLFNMGVVKLNGLNDKKGAIAAWQHLLDANPNYPDRQKVQEMLQKAKGQG